MKYLASFLFIVLLATFLAACSSPSDPSPVSSNADAYFFQPDLTQVYTYLEDDQTSSLTSSYRVSLSDFTNPYSSYFKLESKDSSVLFYFKSEQATDGSTLCLLSGSAGDKGIVALKGSLDLGATWFADEAQSIQATVVGKYTEYYLPGRQVHYGDVVVVKYVDKTKPQGEYTVRYFARNFGLIFEKVFTGDTGGIMPTADIWSI
jgi:hypothetical protein